MTSLYFHIPFCEHKCLYCDFYSIEHGGDKEQFIEALEAEVGLYSPFASDEVDTIYFGGGTPSLLSPEQLGRIIHRVQSIFPVRNDAEITIEVNPGTVDASKLESYRRLGINRLSIGIQSFNDGDLRFLTRIHNANQAVASVQAARSAGFSNISIDLIFALPGQTLDQWQDNLRRAIDLGPEHISAYSLIVEPTTPLARMVTAGLVKPLLDDEDAAMYDITMQTLEDAGYEHYEVSNYARSGYRSRHNSAYWKHRNYLGFGPSAHSFWAAPAIDHFGTGVRLSEVGASRWWNVSNLNGYINTINSAQRPVAGQEVLTELQLFEESILLGLRSDGVDCTRLLELFGVDLQPSDQIHDFIDAGFVLFEEDRLRLTRQGYHICDEIVRKLVTCYSPVSTCDIV